MEIRFGDRDLEARYLRSRLAERAWGRAVARKYILRVREIQRAASEAELRAIRSMRFHALTGDRAGRYAITLNQSWRLEIRLEGEIVVIEEVSNHYGD